MMIDLKGTGLIHYLVSPFSAFPDRGSQHILIRCNAPTETIDSWFSCDIPMFTCRMELLHLFACKQAMQYITGHAHMESGKESFFIFYLLLLLLLLFLCMWKEVDDN